MVVVLGALTLTLGVAACTRTVTHEKASGGYVGYDTDDPNRGTPNGIVAGGATFSEEPPNTGPANYEGSQEAKVSFNGNGGIAKAYKGIDVNIPSGDYDGYYGAAFYFPKGTFSGDTPLQNGDVEIMGWNNNSNNDFTGIRLSGADHLARLIKRTSGGSPQNIGNPVPMREGCWNWVVVHQKLSTTQPQNEVYVNGRRMSQSTQANSFSGSAQVQYGLVSTTSQQTRNFNFYLDESYVSNTDLLQPRAAACEPPPNVVFIITDDQRADGTVVPTVMDQTITRFKNNGTYFPNAVSTTPLCCPSRSSILSGRYAHNHLVQNNNAAGNLNQTATLPRYLKDVGYRTALYGKYLNSWRVYKPPPYIDKYGVFDTSAYGNTGAPNETTKLRVNDEGTYSYLTEYSTDYVKRKAIEFVDAQESNDQQPWFMYLSVAAPHNPWKPAFRHTGRSVPTFSPTPAYQERNGAANDLSDKPQWVRTMSPAGDQASQDAFNAGVQTTRDSQLKTLMAVDELVGDLFTDLDAKGETQDTLAIFMSDNGWIWGEHGLSSKGKPYTDSIEIPFYARWPHSSAFPAAQSDSDWVGNIDMAPTVLDAVGIAPNPVMDGISLLDPALHRNKILTEYWSAGDDDEPTSPGVWASLVSATTQYTEYYQNNGAVRHADPNGREYYTNMNTEPGKWQLTNILNDTDLNNDPTPAELQALHDDLTKQRLCSGSNCAPNSGASSTTDTVNPLVDFVTPRTNGHVTGTVPIEVNARDNFGIARVDFLVRQGATIVATPPSVTDAPFRSSWNSTPGSYTIQAIAYDEHGNASTTAVLPVTVDGFDVQTANPNGTPVGHAEQGDVVKYFFPQGVDPGSLFSGWDGTLSKTVTVTVHADAGPDPFYNDSITVGGAGVPADALGEIDLGSPDYAAFQPNAPSCTNSQMSLSQPDHRVVTIVLDSCNVGATNYRPSNMTWRTGTATVGGVNPCASSCYVTESGSDAYDLEF